ncbi:MAG: cell division protein ZipA C-terminal FtsZ-binding domain-containing protein [Candidatus Sedimenticola sp. (ex Thyasira tokunagai)]
MDADFLRLLLFLAGVVLILGIYFWDRHKRVNVVVHAIKKAQKGGDAAIGCEPQEVTDDTSFETRNEPTLDARQIAEQEPIAQSISDSSSHYQPDVLPEEVMETDTVSSSPTVAGDEPADEILMAPSIEDDSNESLSPTSVHPAGEESDGYVEEALGQLDAIVKEEDAGPSTGEQGSFSFTADVADDFSDGIDGDNLPVKILQLNVVARTGGFCGTDIAKAVTDLQMLYGDMSIYHRYDGDPARGRVLFGMASMVEPGTFPIDRLDDFSTPGVTLFAQLPGYQDGMVIFSDMLFTAERLAVILNGHLQDGEHSDLSKQTISHIREGILEHRRQVQLARSSRR